MRCKGYHFFLVRTEAYKIVPPLSRSPVIRPLHFNAGSSKPCLYVAEGWVTTDVGYTVKNWVEERTLSHSLQIACTTCSIDRDSSLVSVEQTLKPFLVIHTSPLPQKNRPKRNSNCVPEMKECCRDELYISFDEIGWSDWILHPSGYHAYFCRGSCSSTTSLTANGSGHSNVIRVSILH